MNKTRKNKTCKLIVRLIVFPFFLVMASCMTTTRSNEDSPKTYQKIGEPVVVAILEFENKTKYGERRLADSAMEILTTELSRTGNFTLVERSKMNEIMSEIEFQYSGNTSDENLTELGNLLNCQYFIVGSITSFGVKTEGRDFIVAQSKFQIAKTEVDMRLIKVDTAQILHSSYGEGMVEKKIRSGTIGGASGGYDETIAGETLRMAIVDAVHDLNGFLAM